MPLNIFVVPYYSGPTKEDISSDRYVAIFFFPAQLIQKFKLILFPVTKDIFRICLWSCNEFFRLLLQKLPQLSCRYFYCQNIKIYWQG